MARRHGDTWYIAGINAEEKEKTITVSLPMLSGKEVTLHSDKSDKQAQINKVNLKNNKQITLKLLSGGGAVITGKQITGI